ncbi:hypothetical protein FHU38_004523 [Saccharomonospora amisosensis]|uniref:Lipoprotein n=1 Tax=Saccharomonospora amisosensis TaxID=1128677 RepID=A0A7X5UTX3_9PSEU|nr:hypothetical protein [Saccharomonospora amisosensis]NIJ14179.1 hypothetical protein [Saccharomonospora amisosensis]
MTQRVRRLITLGAALVLIAGCSPGRAGTAIPDGDEVTRYVNAKFTATLDRLDDEISSRDPRKSTHRSFTRIDDKKADTTYTAIQVGSPPSRLYKNHSNRDSSDYRDYFHPAGSDVEYVFLGPEYASLAPTPWVSMPYDGAGLNNCFWGGYASLCKMLAAVSTATQNGEADKQQAKNLVDGSVELVAEIPLSEFLNQRVVVLPDWALARISDQMRKGMLRAQIRLGPDGKLQEIRMTGKISDGEHEVQINEHYQVQDPPTEEELPNVPPPEQLTVLTAEAEVDDFYDRMNEITSAGG